MNGVAGEGGERAGGGAERGDEGEGVFDGLVGEFAAGFEPDESGVSELVEGGIAADGFAELFSG